ncbi:hypothetical protein JNB71_03555 [Rhizobium herbae]|uniref:Uncharacterized protein n=1 Tax=Rhizobium herbae TaxID=508661 RepID=A0ABS7H5L3_9HYPH|nr:hypothetical protein [Rhizobium herbae]MBW9062388.1 hypothetical protein [Rhizobium herbae]
MDTLIFKVAVRMATGFSIGFLTLLIIVYGNPSALGHGNGIDVVGLCLQTYAFGAPFAIGYLCTGLGMGAL